MGSSRRRFIGGILGLPLVGRLARRAVYALTSGSRRTAPPMIGRVTAHEASLHLHAARPERVRLRWGRAPDRLDAERLRRVDGDATLRMTGLPHGGVCYRLDRRPDGASEFLEGAVQRFHTQRRRGESYRFAALADAHLVRGHDDSDWYEPLRVAAANLAREELDFVVFLGDEATIDGSGRPAEAVRNQGEAFERYALLRQIYAPLLERVPSFFVLGNHDGERLYKATVRDGERPRYLMRWGAIARKRYLLNPGPDTYPEGGEDAGWAGPDDDPALAGAADGHASPLHNYYAWSWGDATFVVLDPFRYTPVEPTRPEQWRLGATQLEWMRDVLATSDRRHKVVICHHLVGGAPWDASVSSTGAYARGGARFADRGDQVAIHEAMVDSGAGLFLYGHDHVVAHDQRDGVNYLCCGRPWNVSGRWWDNPGWGDLYGDAFTGLPGAMIFDVTPDSITARYLVTAASSPRSTRWEAPRFPVDANGELRVDDPVLGVVRVWDPQEPDVDLFPGGSFEGRTIRLGRRWQGRAGRRLHVLHLGQTAFRRRFS